jgi:hypothetical protein
MGKYLWDTFAVQKGLKQGNALTPLLFICVLEYAISKAQETCGNSEVRMGKYLWDTFAVQKGLKQENA